MIVVVLYFKGRFWFFIKLFELFFVNLKEDIIVLDVVSVVRRVFVVSVEEFIFFGSYGDVFEILVIEVLNWVIVWFKGVEIEDVLKCILLVCRWIILDFILEVNICILCSKFDIEVLICLRLEIFLLLLENDEFNMEELDFKDDFFRVVVIDWCVLLMFFWSVMNFKFEFKVLVIWLIWFCMFFKFVGVEDNVVVDKFIDFCVIDDNDWLSFLKVFCRDFRFFKLEVVEVWFCIFDVIEVGILVVFLINLMMDWLINFKFFWMFFELL